MGKCKLIHKFSLMNLTWANVTVRSLVRAPLELWPAGDNITHWGQLRSCQYSENSRDDMGFNHIQPIYGKSFGMIWLFWFDDLNWVYLIFSGWDETSIHSSWGLVKSTFRHREPLNTGWKSWDTSPIRLCLLSMNIMNYENPIFRFDVFRSLWTADFHAYVFDMFRTVNKPMKDT